MRLPAYFAAILLAFAAILTACNSAEQKKPDVAAAGKPTSAPVPGDGVRRVTVQELVDMVGKGQAVIVDVRTAGAFSEGHIKGALLMPHNEIQNHLSELPHDKLIVTYCA